MIQPEHVDPANAIPAATVIIFRKSRSGGAAELLMVTRSHDMAFAAGAAVFPGGRIDPADRELVRRLGLPGEFDEQAARIAAIRETLEETGLAIGLTGRIDGTTAADARAMLLEQGELAPVLDRFGWTLAPDRLTPFARWLPKLKHNRSFDTRFFLADLGTGEVDIAIDDTENIHLFWSSAQDTLASADRGDVRIIYPTRRNLERLAQFSTFGQAREHALAIPCEIVSPWLDETGDVPMLRIPDDRGYPVTAEPFDTAFRG